MRKNPLWILLYAAVLVVSCVKTAKSAENKDDTPSFLQLNDKYAITLSPAGAADTLWFDKPLERVVFASILRWSTVVGLPKDSVKC